MSRDINQEKLEESKRHQFDAYCKKILRNEARDIYDERKRRQKRVPFARRSGSDRCGLGTRRAQVQR